MTSSQFPSKEEMAKSNLILAPSRGLSRYQKFTDLTKFVTEDDLPYGFRSKRGPKPHWGPSDVHVWEDLKNTIGDFGEASPGSYRLPDGSILTIGESRDYIDGDPLPSKLPLFDIATWLANEERAWNIRDWKLFLRALSCASTSVWAVSDWATFFGVHSWPGIDSPVQRANITESLPSPFMELVSMYCFHNEMEERSIGNIARGNPRAMEDIGGYASREWIEIVNKGDTEMKRLFGERVSPRLIIHDRRLHMVVLEGGRPSLVRVPIEPKFWKCLVSFMLEPPGHPGSDLMRDVFWTWHKGCEAWELSRPELRAAGLLRDLVEELGEDSSLEPVKFLQGHGLFVRGRSGVCYVIFAMTQSSKFGIWAIPDVEDKGAAVENGIFVCIDPYESVSVPPGDIAIQYLMALRDDVSSGGVIETLQLIFHCIEVVDLNKNEVGVDTWWREVCDLYEYGGEYPEDYWDVEDNEQEPEIAVPPSIEIGEETWQELEERHGIRIRLMSQEGEDDTEWLLEQGSGMDEVEHHEAFMEWLEERGIQAPGEDSE